MRYETAKRQAALLLSVKAQLDTRQCTYPIAHVRCDAEGIYGRSISDRTWNRWLSKCAAHTEAESGFLGEGAYVLLCTLARLLRGNGPSERRVKVSRLKLAIAVAQGGEMLGQELPASLTYEELRLRAESQAMSTYSDRHHRRMGLKKGQQVYTRVQAQQILNNYPRGLRHA